MGRFMTLDDLVAELATMRKGRTLVFTNGCFDLLHVGHVRCLAQARALGDFLVVGVNSDESVRRLKGEGRPLVPEVQRAEVVAALGAVDFVTLFPELTPVETIARVKPDIHVKGGDYRDVELPEADEVGRHGGRIVIVELQEAPSVKDLIAKASRAATDPGS